MKYKYCEFRLGEPDNFLLGISRLNGQEEEGFEYNEICFGLLFFSIAIIFDVKRKI